METSEIVGLKVRRKALNEISCQALVESIEAQGWFNSNAKLNQRMVFGKLPALVQPILNQSDTVLPPSFENRGFDQMIANVYAIGDGIDPHVDLDRFEDGILVFSLKGTCIMEFTRDVTVEIFLGPGDLIGLSGEARFEWKHGIPRRNFDVVNGISIPRSERISLTFRKVHLDSDSDTEV